MKGVETWGFVLPAHLEYPRRGTAPQGRKIRGSKYDFWGCLWFLRLVRVLLGYKHIMRAILSLKRAKKHKKIEKTQINWSNTDS